jgi:hypothetical protein
VAPTATALSPDLAQLLQTMARDLATAGQEIEQLKTGQEQLIRDNEKLAEQFKASQEQMARVVAKASEAKASEQNLRPKVPAAPPVRPAAAPTRKPVSTLRSPQAAVQLQSVTQPQAEEPASSSAPRSPMPLR